MSWFNNLGIQTKLLAGFGSVCLLLATVGYLGIKTADSINNDVSYVGQNVVPSIDSALVAEIRIIEAQRNIRSLILETDASKRDTVRQQLDANYVDFETFWNEYKSLPASQEEIRIAGEIDKAYPTWLAGMKEAEAVAVSGTSTAQKDALSILAAEVAPLGVQMVDNFKSLVKALRVQTAETLEQASDN